MASPLRGLKEAQPKQHQMSKEAVVYMDGDKGPFKCSNCEYWVDPNKCQIVSGNIDPDGCCNLYEKNDE